MNRARRQVRHFSGVGRLGRKSAKRSSQVTNPYKLSVDPPPSLVNHRRVATEVNHATRHGCRQHTIQLSASREHIEIGFAAHEGAVFVERQYDGRDFEQCVGRRVESAGFDINDNGQESPETGGDRDRAGHDPVTDKSLLNSSTG